MAGVADGHAVDSRVGVGRHDVDKRLVAGTAQPLYVVKLASEGLRD